MGWEVPQVHLWGRAGSNEQLLCIASRTPLELGNAVGEGRKWVWWFFPSSWTISWSGSLWSKGWIPALLQAGVSISQWLIWAGWFKILLKTSSPFADGLRSQQTQGQCCRESCGVSSTDFDGELHWLWWSHTGWHHPRNLPEVTGGLDFFIPYYLGNWEGFTF